MSIKVANADSRTAHSIKAAAAAEWVLILGATSGIARALAHRLARDGRSLLLAGRNRDEMARMSADLTLRYGIQADVIEFDALEYSSHATFFESCIVRTAGRLTGVFVCYGEMFPQLTAETSLECLRRTIDVNFTSAASILSLVASYLEERRSGFIGVITSVAGDRGRQSNYVYGAAKAGLAVLTQGLRNRLFKSGVHVLTIKPGFVATRMTAGLLNPNSPLVARPEQVANDIVRALNRRRPVVYTPWFWWYIMVIICAIPERIFQRMKL